MSATRFPFTRQRGAVNLIAVMLMFTMVMAVLGTIMVMSATDVMDSKQQSDSVRALLLAESAVERAMGRLALGTVCASLVPDSGSQGSGSFSVVSAAVSGSNCQIQASGSIGNVTRTVNALATIPSGGGGTSISAGTAASATAFRNANTDLNLSYTVPTGTAMLLVGASVNNTQNNDLPTITVTYGGTAMTLRATAVGSNPWPVAQIWSLTDPPAGTANVTIRANRNSEIVLGALSFSGVDTATPLDVAAVTRAATSNDASLPIAPVTAGAWVFEVLAINVGKTTTMQAVAGQTRTSRWNSSSNGNVQGAASTIGPINPAVSVTPRWTWSGPEKWSLAAVALRPNTGGTGVSTLLQWSEAVNY